MNYQDCPSTGKNILHMSPLIKSTLSQKSITLKKYLKVFLVNLKLIDQYQQKDPSLKDKYEVGTYKNILFVEDVIYITTL